MSGKMTKEQLMKELDSLRRRITEMEALEAERRQVERMLAESEEKYRLLFDNYGDPITVYGIDGRLLLINAIGAKNFGGRPEDFVGKSCAELFPEQGSTYLERLRTVALSGLAADFEDRVKLPSGERWFGSSMQPIRGEKSNVHAVQIISHDITERKQAEEALRQSEERFRMLFESTREGIVLSGSDGRILSVNPAAAAILGYNSPQELVDKFGPELYANLEQRKTVSRQLREKGHTEDMELALKRKDCTLVYVLGSSIIRKDSEGKVLRVETVWVDITERKRAEKALQESEEKYRSLVTNIPDAVWTATSQGDLVFMSPNVEAITGYTPEEMCQGGYQMLFERTYPDDVKMMMERIGPQVEKGMPFDVEYRFRRKDGGWIWLHTRTTAGYEKDGTTYTDGVSTDITERKRMEQELKEYSENLELMVEKRTRELKDAQEKLVRTEKLAAIGQLAGGVGHELRNPLAAIKTSAYFLKMKLGKTAEEKVNKHLDMLEKQVDACNKIITDLLDFSRPGKTNIVEVDINQVVREMVKTIGAPANVEIATSLAADLPKVMADSGQLERIFSNLISNAIQAMPDGGSLSLRTSQSGGFVEVKVADTGVGIPQENLDKIFEPLFTTKAKGVGLGLAIGRALVERHGGTIGVESQVGKGTTFTVRLPVVGK